MICGDNAQGKTNLLEAVWLFTGGRSFRGARDQELIAFSSQAGAVLALDFEAEEREQTAKITIGRGAKKRTAQLNGVDPAGCLVADWQILRRGIFSGPPFPC